MCILCSVPYGYSGTDNVPNLVLTSRLTIFDSKGRVTAVGVEIFLHQLIQNCSGSAQ
jgi:hypothetical protein